MNPQIFREYDIRGVVDKDLTPKIVETLGKAFGSYIQDFQGKEIVVARDNRLSSKLYRDALISGIVSTGCSVLDIGEVPSPVFYFSLIHYEKDGGMMITASHNPPEFNGFKISRGHSSIYGEEIQKLRKIIESGKFREGKGQISSKDPRAAYLSCLKERVNLKRELKVVVDAGNGTTSDLAPSLLEELGCRVIKLYCESDGRFPNHHPDPTIPDNLKDLIATVQKEKADLGIAYDGDGDRIGVVDEKGKIIWGDRLMIIFARKILKKHPGAKVVFEVKCSQSLIEEIEKAGGVPLMWKTGHSLIESKIREEGALLAGEMSGHIYFADNYFGYDDAIFASCRLVEILSGTEKRLSQLLEGVTEYHSTPEIRIECPDEKKFEVVEKVKKYFREKYEIIDIDGVRVLFGDGWGLVRASNTQAVLVLRFEARTEKRMEEIKSLVMTKLKEVIG
ncbi:MAG: phosphomannomutase/phosphoglucomutase [Nitrospirae bacterium]|nr:phosphomannomutase/phosphoglucomutase [Nitrospirota bacterium]